jgi:putative exporter of polyketide antibiotics
MELLNFVSGDNLFKYTFTLGLVMVVFSLVYPLQKKHEIELEIVNQNKEAKLLNKEIDNLSKITLNLEKTSDLLIKKAVKFKANKRNKLKMKSLVDKFNLDFDSAQRNKQAIEVKTIILEFNKTKIEVLQQQANSFDKYSFWLSLCGITFTVFGLVFWTIRTFKKQDP